MNVVALTIVATVVPVLNEPVPDVTPMIIPTDNCAVLETVMVVPTDAAVAVAMLLINHLYPGLVIGADDVGVAVNKIAVLAHAVFAGALDTMLTDCVTGFTVNVATDVVSDEKQALLIYALNWNPFKELVMPVTPNEVVFAPLNVALLTTLAQAVEAFGLTCH